MIKLEEHDKRKVVERGTFKSLDSTEYIITKVDFYKDKREEFLKDPNLRELIKPPHYCGYVSFPRKLRQWEQNQISVHGGVTFCEIPDDGNVYLVGFDCGHYSDTPESCPLEYVREQCEKLALQLHKIKQRPVPDIELVKKIVSDPDEWMEIDHPTILEIITALEHEYRDMIYYRDRCNHLEEKLRDLGCVVKP